MSILEAEVEIAFGSYCRGEIDALSDRDILIIDKDYDVLSDRYSQLSKQGYSVAKYDWNRFNKLVSKQSLFIQHLKQEGLVLNDRCGSFDKAIINFKPKTSYEIELKENEHLFDLLKVYPKTQKGLFWFLDTLYVSLRNYGILYLASFKKYHFSFSDILKELAALNIISPNDVDFLSQLRETKFAYRNDKNIVDEKSLFEFVNRVINAVRLILKFDPISVDPSKINDFVHKPDLKASNYCHIKYLEMLLICIKHCDPEMEKSQKIIQIDNWLKDPRMYGGLLSKEMDNIFSDIESLCLVK